MLPEYIEEKKRVRFEWGKCDCVMFACDWVERMLGFNPASASKGKYTDAISAYKHLNKVYGGLKRGFDGCLTRTENPINGDICLCLVDGAETMGIYAGDGAAYFKMEHGVVYKRGVKIVAFWEVRSCLR